jgi:hypothetical protein
MLPINETKSLSLDAMLSFLSTWFAKERKYLQLDLALRWHCILVAFDEKQLLLSTSNCNVFL